MSPGDRGFGPGALSSSAPVRHIGLLLTDRHPPSQSSLEGPLHIGRSGGGRCSRVSVNADNPTWVRSGHRRAIRPTLRVKTTGAVSIPVRLKRIYEDFTAS
jgi:hypothetical protein